MLQWLHVSNLVHHHQRDVKLENFFELHRMMRHKRVRWLLKSSSIIKDQMNIKLSLIQHVSQLSLVKRISWWQQLERIAVSTHRRLCNSNQSLNIISKSFASFTRISGKVWNWNLRPRAVFANSNQNWTKFGSWWAGNLINRHLIRLLPSNFSSICFNSTSFKQLN